MSNNDELKRLNQLVRQYISTKEAIKNATEGLDTLTKMIETIMKNLDVTSYEVDNRTVNLVKAERRAFNAQALKALVNQSIFRSLTEVEVRAKLVDAAIDSGKVSQDVIKQITTTTPYTQLRIN